MCPLDTLWANQCPFSGIWQKKQQISIKTLFVIKSDIICISCNSRVSRVCKFPKNSMDENYMHPEIKDQAPKVLWESKDMYHCHPHHFLEIFETQVNEPIVSYQIHHLKCKWDRKIQAMVSWFPGRQIFHKPINCIQSVGREVKKSCKPQRPK